jgi:acetyl esterase/lipase
MQPIPVDYGLRPEKNRFRTILFRCLKILLVLLLLISLSFGLARVWLSRSAGNLGQPPAGYGSLNEIYAAILIGALPVIDRQPPIPPAITLRSGITYAKTPQQELKLDLYQPAGANASQRRPILVLIHGGGWKSGEREDYRPYAIRVAEAGYVVASLSYRLTPVAKFPAAARDVNAALQFLANRSDEFGIDPNRMVLMGGSAGGHLAMLAGYSDDPQLKPEPVEEKNLEYKIAAVFNFYGPCDLTTDFAKNHDLVTDFLGTKIEEHPEVYRQASPLFAISQGDPPTVIVHGTLDDIVPVEQSDSLAVQLRNAGIPVHYERIEGWPHTMDLAEPMFEYLSKMVLEQLRQAVGRAEIAASPPLYPSNVRSRFGP